MCMWKKSVVVQWVLVVVAGLISSHSARADVIINFDDLPTSMAATTFAGDVYQSQGLLLSSVNIPNEVSVNSILTLANPVNQFEVRMAPTVAVSAPNFAVAIDGLNGGINNDLLFSFTSPIISLQLATDKAENEGPDIVRLLLLEATGNANEFRVVSIAEGIDNATTSPANLLSVSGSPFSFALFQVTTEAEGVDDVTFVFAPPAANGVPAPAALPLALLGIGTGWLLRRKK